MSGSVPVPAVLPPLRLVCLSHAGGSALLYRRWAQRLPRGVQVLTLELPGHGARRALSAHTEWPALLDTLLVELDGRLDAEVPFAVFGHSMGALVGFELMHALRARDGLEPVWFGASASVAPAHRKHETHWLDCTHEAMVDKLRELGGTPAALLEDRDFIDFVLPVLRADFHLCGSYPSAFGRHATARRDAATGLTAPTAPTAQRGIGREPLACPIAVFTGRDDHATARDEDVAAWRDETRGACTLHRFEGGHFYLDGAPDPVMACVATSLADALAQPVERDPV
ncbi:thioesterase II family protein [Paraburkholderia phenazinium]|uniref:thioesterase II family protein n=1 Tax=Paraburkholderia phenazinium TaxID=60549 RepID=UPI000B8A366A|nr:alpha/beta fold hydrolase [Paraburkholderia phenazinium]